MHPEIYHGYASSFIPPQKMGSKVEGHTNHRYPPVDHYMPLAQIRVMFLRSSKKYHQIHNKKQEKPAGQIITLQETNISPPKGTFEDNMPFPIVDMLVPWRAIIFHQLLHDFPRFKVISLQAAT